MKTLIVAFLSIFLFGNTKDLKVQITNIKKIKGRMVIAVYVNSKNYLKPGHEFYRTKVDVKSSELNVVIPNLPMNKYSIAIYQDENMDGVCNLNFIGMPTEGFGFSNNYRPIYRAPRFSETQINENVNSVNISLIN